MPTRSSECQSSIRLHSFSLGAFPQVCHGDIGIKTVFRKSYEKGSFEFCFTENTIRNCKNFDFPEATLRISSIVHKAAIPPYDDTIRDMAMRKSAHVLFDFGSMVIREACLEVQKALGGEKGSSMLRVKASWSPNTSSFTLDEAFVIDSKNVVCGSYDFLTDEAVFGYERTLTDSWKASAKFNVQSSCAEYTVDRIFNANDNTMDGLLSMKYCPEKENASISYDQGQWQTSFALNTNSWVAGFLPIPSIDSMTVKYIHTFDI